MLSRHRADAPASAELVTDALLAVPYEWRRCDGVWPAHPLLSPAGGVPYGRVHADDRPAVRASLASSGLTPGTVIDLVYRLVDDEQHAPVRDLARVLADGTDVVVRGLVVPGGSAAAELLAAREAQAHLERVVETLSECLYTLDLGQDPPRMVWLSPGWRRLLGLSDDAALDVDALLPTWIHPDDTAIIAELNEGLARGESVDGEYRVVRADGDVRWVRERATAHWRGAQLLADGSVTDITERRLAREHAERLEASVRDVLSAVGEFVYTVDVVRGRARVRFTGPGLDRLLGGPITSRRGPLAALRDAVVDEDRDLVDSLAERLRAGEEASAVYRIRGCDGNLRWLWERGRPHADGRGYDGVVSDVTERERATEQIALGRDLAERRSRVDALTGLPNRLAFSERLAYALRHRRSVAVVLVDIDLLKAVNERIGRSAGDAVLRGVSRNLEAAVRASDRVARWGGDEFAILLDSPPAGDDDLRDFCERLRVAASGSAVELPGVTLAVSAGSARVGPGRATVDALMGAAERALQSAKRLGRDRLRLESDLADHHELIEEPDVIRIAETMSRSAAVREGVPAEHPEEVAELAAAIASRLGLSPTQILRCRLAGWLHDIGKVAVPDRILLKAEALDESEWSIMRSHAAIGADMVSHIPGLAGIAPAIRHHHERVDGGGYPDGLAGVDIPIEARVVAVADAYSAMREQRVYRARRSTGAAIAELRLVAGVHVDAHVVDALEAVLARRGTRARRRVRRQLSA